MHTTNLISSALREQHPEWLPGLPSATIEGVCALTGEKTPCLPRSKVLGKSFTNQSLLSDPESPYIGVDVFYAWFSGYYAAPDVNEKHRTKLVKKGISEGTIDLLLSLPRESYHDQEDFRKEFEHQGGTQFDAILSICGKKRLKVPERMSSWLCDGDTFQELSRQDVRESVLYPKKAALWAAYATTSYKKHGSLIAPINGGDSAVWLFEETRVDCSDVKNVADYWQRLTAAQSQGFGRPILESVDCPASLISKYGFRQWQAFARWAKPRREEALYQFLCYLLPSMEELKHENTVD